MSGPACCTTSKAVTGLPSQWMSVRRWTSTRTVLDLARERVDHPRLPPLADVQARAAGRAAPARPAPRSAARSRSSSSGSGSATGPARRSPSSVLELARDRDQLLGRILRRDLQVEGPEVAGGVDPVEALDLEPARSSWSPERRPLEQIRRRRSSTWLVSSNQPSVEPLRRRHRLADRPPDVRRPGIVDDLDAPPHRPSRLAGQGDRSQVRRIAQASAREGRPR